MNKYNYPEQFMHGQNDLRWSWRQVALSGRTMKDIGCALTCLAYVISRHDGVDITPGKYLDWITQKAKDANWQDYLTSDGRVYWNSADRFTINTVVSTKNPLEAHYTLVEVFWGSFRHWMVELKGGLVFNPYGYTVELLAQPKWIPTGHKEYYKAVTPPKT